MKEIKFKAWDKHDKRFVKSVQENRVPTANTKEGFRLKSRFIFLPFIGIKDKNKKPIYLGHILQWSYRGGEKFTAKVVYGHYSVGRDSWGQELFTVGYFLQFYDNGICGIGDSEKYTIIGNIFENLHLLNSPKQNNKK